MEYLSNNELVLHKKDTRAVDGVAKIALAQSPTPQHRISLTPLNFNPFTNPKLSLLLGLDGCASPTRAGLPVVVGCEGTCEATQVFKSLHRLVSENIGLRENLIKQTRAFFFSEEDTPLNPKP